jgi:hypothetical protein
MTSHVRVAPPPLRIGPTALVRFFALFTLVHFTKYIFFVSYMSHLHETAKIGPHKIGRRSDFGCFV